MQIYEKFIFKIWNKSLDRNFNPKLFFERWKRNRALKLISPYSIFPCYYDQLFFPERYKETFFFLSWYLGVQTFVFRAGRSIKKRKSFFGLSFRPYHDNFGARLPLILAALYFAVSVALSCKWNCPKCAKSTMLS